MTPSTNSPTLVISGLEYLQGQHHLFPLHLASFCAYASSAPLPEHLQGSIPGPWLAVTWAGFAPARLRGIAKPLPPDHLVGPQEDRLRDGQTENPGSPEIDDELVLA